MFLAQIGSMQGNLRLGNLSGRPCIIDGRIRVKASTCAIFLELTDTVDFLR
jgi:hypothetical protein